jgi:uncharacterized protein (TIGR02391 family)
MSDVITLSRLLSEATALQRLAKRIGDTSRSSRPPLTWQEYEARYRTWYEESLSLLPPEFQTPFIRGYTEGVWHHPALRQVFVVMLAQETGSTAEVDVNIRESIRAYGAYFALQEVLEHQRDQLFYARRRVWTGVSALPKGMASAVARICKQTFYLASIEGLFIRSGCEPHWQLPPFQPDPDSERVNETLGWLDGITVYAPEREVAIIQAVCESILTRQNLTTENRVEIEGWLTQLQQPASPPAPNPLDRYPVHPTVRRIAGPLMASGHHSDAILRVCIELNQTVQQITGSTLDGSKLMQQVFSPNNPLLRLAQDDTEQLGWMQLFTGLIQAVRNPRAHRHVDDADEDATVRWLMFASALFGALDAAVAAAAPQPPTPPASSP